jgi:tRNA dimethylallyltransferase
VKPLVVFIVGSTAVGKSKIALTLAKKLKGEIISADSMQVYQGMDIGTAKPSLSERKRIPHHLINTLSPTRRFSAFQYRKLALKKIQEIIKRGNIPFVVGGSGLYVRALLRGFSGQPGGDMKVRKNLEKEARDKGLPILYERLRKKDPVRAGAIKPNDQFRIIRALEILETTKKKPSDWYEKNESLESLGYKIKVIGLTKDRAVLYRDIEARVDLMFRKGLFKEVLKLSTLKLSTTAAQAVGYKEVLKGLKEKQPLQNAKNEIKLNTRHLAKRQITWFKKEQGIHWFDVSSATLFRDLLDFLRQ